MDTNSISTVDVDAFREALPDSVRQALVLPGSPDYATATSPENTTAQQHPAAVVLASTAADVAGAVAAAARVGARVAAQATGHGAAGLLDPDVILIDTSRLASIEIDAERRIARIGAGAWFGAVNTAAFEHGLLAPAGTSPSVAVAGYTALGGSGWLTRPHGLASASLVSVDVVDGGGRLLHADDDEHADVLWAWRGGGGAGIATMLELRLFPADELRAGYLLWPVEHAETVLPAWGRATSGFSPALATAIGVLHAPKSPAVPDALQDTMVVHLAAATVAGEEGEASLRDFLAGLPRPTVDTFGPSDAATLAQIHLDPPSAVPAQGEGRWLTADAADLVHEILTAAGTGTDSPLPEVELRHVASPASAVPGALTTVAGPFALHATGPAPTPEAQRAVLAALDTVLAAAAPAETGFSAPAFRDGRTDDGTALPPDVAERITAIRRAIDPDGVITGTRTSAA